MLLARLLLLVPILFAAPWVGAQPAFPTKPLRVVVPYSAGGAVDSFARPVAHKLSEQIGQPVIVDNRPGANATLGSDNVAKAAPDGHTILLSSVIHYLIPLYSKNVPYDPVKDFTPIIVAAFVPNIVAVHPSLPVHSIRDLVAYGKANPGKLYYGSAGIGSSHHLGGVLLAQAAGIHLEHVPYKGGNPTINDAVSGAVPMVILTAPTVMPHARAGRLRSIAVIENRRAKIAPELPTVRETLPAYEMPNTWFGFYGPASVPPAIVNRLNAELQKAISTPEVTARLESLGFEVLGGSVEDMHATIKRDIPLYRKVVDAAGIRPE